MYSHRLSGLLCFAVLVSCSGLARAGEPEARSPSVTSILPGKALVAIHLPSVPAMCKAIDESDYGRLMLEPEVQLFIKPFWDAMKKKYAQTRVGMPMLPKLKDIEKVFTGDVAAVVLPPPQGAPIPTVCLAVKIGDAKAASDLLKPVLGGKPLPEATVVPMGPPGGPALVYEKGLLLVSSSDASLQQMRTNLGAQQAAGTLAADPGWMAAGKLLGENSLLAGYVSVQGLLTIAKAQIKQSGDPDAARVAGLLNKSGVEGIKEAAFQFGTRGKVLTFDCATTVDGQPKGLVAALYDAKPIAADALKVVPEGAAFCSASRFDATRIIAELRALLEPKEIQELDKALAQAKQMTGVDIEKDLIAPLGDTWVAYDVGGFEFMGMMPSMALSVSTKDAAALEAGIGKLAAAIEQIVQQQAMGMGPVVQVKKVNLGKNTVNYLNVTSMPLSPSWTIADKRLLVTLSVAGMRRALKQLGAGKDITGTPGFKEALERVTGAALDPQALPGQFTYVGVSKASFSGFSSLGQLASGGLKLAAKQPRAFGGRPDPEMVLVAEALDKLDFALFPPDEVILKHLRPVASALIKKEGGVVVRSDLTLPTPGAMGSGQGALALPVIAAIAIPNLLRSRMAANESAAIAGCKMYAAAQDIYRRTDWDADGILEYAQSIHGVKEPKEVPGSVVPEPNQETRAAFDKLFPKLSSEDYGQREAATKGLRKLGPKAIKLLEAAGKQAKDAEVRTRCLGIANSLKRSLQPSTALDTRHGLYSHKKEADLTLVDRAFAKAEGNPSEAPQPKAGYCFKVLTGQGPQAPGGRKSYLVPAEGPATKRNLTLGYALVAYPAQYDKTGRNTFIINNTGTVYQKDMGPETPQIVEKMTEYNPDQTWVVAE